MIRARHIIWITPVLTATLLWALPAAAQNHKPRKPYRCTGQTDKVLSGVEISTAGIAVKVTGNCTLHINNSFIRGGKTAIKVTGNGTLSIRNSTVVSSRTAVLTTGNGTTNAKNSTFHGRNRVKGNGDFNNNGGNKFRKPGGKVKAPKAPPPRAEAPAPPPADKPKPKPGKGYRKHAVIKCLGAGRRTLRRRLRRPDDHVGQRLPGKVPRARQCDRAVSTQVRRKLRFLNELLRVFRQADPPDVLTGEVTSLLQFADHQVVSCGEAAQVRRVLRGQRIRHRQHLLARLQRRPGARRVRLRSLAT